MPHRSLDNAETEARVSQGLARMVLVDLRKQQDKLSKALDAAVAAGLQSDLENLRWALCKLNDAVDTLSLVVG